MKNTYIFQSIRTCMTVELCDAINEHQILYTYDYLTYLQCHICPQNLCNATPKLYPQKYLICSIICLIIINWLPRY